MENGFFNITDKDKKNGIGFKRLENGDVAVVVYSDEKKIAQMTIRADSWTSAIMSVCGDPTNSMINEIIGKIHAAF